MKLTQANKSALLIALTEAIQGGYIRSWGWVGFPEEWENQTKASLDPDFSKALYEKLDDGGLSSLIRKYILSKLYENGIKIEVDEDKKLKSYKIGDFSIFSDPLGLARDICAIIEGMPYKYLVCVEAFVKDCGKFKTSFELKFTDRLSLVSHDRIPSTFETKSENEEINNLVRIYNSRGEKFEKINDSGVYFLYHTSGVITDRSRPKCFIDMYDDIRAFYGACLVFDIANYSSFFKEDMPVPVFGNKRVDAGHILEIVEQADTDITEVSQSYISVEDDKLFQTQDGIERVFKPVIKMFNSSEFVRLRTSAIWLLRSFLSERGMDRILDATIAIEVLLGDRDASDRVGLSKLMANRCAYALGRSANERKELYAFFIEFYRVRSEIVHSGRLKISEEEVKMVNKGVDLASRMLRHEVEMN